MAMPATGSCAAQFLLHLLSFGFVACAHSPRTVSNVPVSRVGELVLTPCVLPGVTQTARCGWYSVAESRTHGGKSIALRVVLLPALASPSAPDPIVIVPGGPGSDVIRAAAFWPEDLARAHTHRSILLLDPRGTGQSGALDCDLDRDTGSLAAYFRDFLPPEAVRSCKDRLERMVDLTAYTTESIADDLDQVREALGIARFNLYGFSGGTRESLIYARKYPARVRSMVLAGVVPSGFRMPLSYARDAQSAFDSLAAYCVRDSACRAAFPRFHEEFAEILGNLELRPAIVTLSRRESRVDTVTVTRDFFAERIRRRLYSPTDASDIPYVVHQARAGNYLPFAEIVVPGHEPPPFDGISVGHFLAVTCSEDVPRIANSEAIAEAAGTFLGTYRVRQQMAACALWPSARLDQEHFKPTQSRVPTLLISGDADPVTPPRWANEAARMLTNSVSIIFRGGGHVPLNPCVEQIAADFISTANPHTTNVSCVDQFKRPPFKIE